MRLRGFPRGHFQSPISVLPGANYRPAEPFIGLFPSGLHFHSAWLGGSRGSPAAGSLSTYCCCGLHIYLFLNCIEGVLEAAEGGLQDKEGLADLPSQLLCFGTRPTQPESRLHPHIVGNAGRALLPSSLRLWLLGCFCAGLGGNLQPFWPLLLIPETFRQMLFSSNFLHRVLEEPPRQGLHWEAGQGAPPQE